MMKHRFWTALATSLTGAFGSAFGTFAMLCCFGWTGLATLLPVLGLGFLVRFTVALRLIWIALGFTALGLGLSFWRHQRPWPLITATLGAGLLLYPMYHAMEVVVWLGLAYSGLALLLLASLMDVWFTRRHARRCVDVSNSSRRYRPKDLQKRLGPHGHFSRE